jgi:hypothetical protein
VTRRLTAAGKFGLANAALWLIVFGADGLILALVSGVFGTLFGYWLFGRRARKTDGMRAKLEAEGIIKDAQASLSALWTHTEGWLFLTKQRLVFEPFDSAHAKLGFDASLVAIETALVRGWFLRERVEVSAHGTTRRLAVDEPADWFVEIKKAAATAQTSARSASE